jgi:hypothetical protein
VRRIIISVVALMAFIGVGFGVMAAPAGARPAQATDAACFPTDASAYPPVGPKVQIEVGLHLVSGHFVPGGTGVLVVGGATAGTAYCGFLFSTPVVLSRLMSDAQGLLSYSQAIPADFALNAMHHVDIYRQQIQVGSFDFCVNKAGDLAPTSECDAARSVSASLPRTGLAWLLDALKVAALLLALGAALLYMRRRRIATHA